MTKDEALKMAISQFKRIDKEYDCTEIIDICKDALEQPTKGIEFEWYNKGWTDAIWEFEWLSDDEILIICAKMAAKLPNKEIDLIFARAIEQALKEKNNG